MVSGVFRQTGLVDYPMKSAHVCKAFNVLEHHHILTSFPGRSFPGDTTSQTKPVQKTPRQSYVLLLAALPFYLFYVPIRTSNGLNSFSTVFGPFESRTAQIYHAMSVSVKLGLAVNTSPPKNGQGVMIEISPFYRFHFHTRGPIFSHENSIFRLRNTSRLLE